MTRFRLTTGPLALFGAIFVIALIALLPLRLVLGQFDLARTGFAAREATGSVWSGALRETAVGSIALGDMGAALSPWPLFVGRARVDLAGHSTTTTRAVHGAVSVSRHSIGVDDMTAVLPGGAVFARFPVSGLDLDDVSVQAYREGALETKDKRVLRIWVGAPVLFAKDANGNEILTDGGRARLDSAMAQFVHYPKTSPFVVEGYAHDVTGDERFLHSRARAQLVRDYIVGKFGLNPQVVAIMPMGSQASFSPTGEQWDGVALAIFVRRTVK